MHCYRNDDYRNDNYDNANIGISRKHRKYFTNKLV